ncbi:MAG: ABC transporter permease subunit [Gammaproteobacteria bacterium]|nr:ABC transporter permease subunit [Gammaproteobacteria bacterium]
MNIILRELKANFKSLLLWSGFIVFFNYMGISKFQAFTAADSDIMAMLDAMPQAVLEGLQLKAFNLTTLSGYYGVMQSYFGLMAAIFAILLGNGIIAKEERDKTVEFSLTLPIPRHRLVTGKVLAALVNCMIFILVMWGGSIIAVQPYEPDAAFYEYLALMMLGNFFLTLIFLALGVLLGAAMKEYKRSGSVAVFVLFFSFILSIVSELSEQLEFLKYFSPFRYFDPLKLLNESKFDLNYLALSAAIVAVSMALAYYSYSRRDLYI